MIRDRLSPNEALRTLRYRSVNFKETNKENKTKCLFQREGGLGFLEGRVGG